MIHETAVLLALACHYVEEEGAHAVAIGDNQGLIEAATSAASLRHVIKYVVEGEESYGRD